MSAPSVSARCAVRPAVHRRSSIGVPTSGTLASPPREGRRPGARPWCGRDARNKTPFDTSMRRAPDVHRALRRRAPARGNQEVYIVSAVLKTARRGSFPARRVGQGGTEGRIACACARRVGGNPRAARLAEGRARAGAPGRSRLVISPEESARTARGARRPRPRVILGLGAPPAAEPAPAWGLDLVARLRALCRQFSRTRGSVRARSRCGPGAAQPARVWSSTGLYAALANVRKHSCATRVTIARADP
jgi:hypothetical protein